MYSETIEINGLRFRVTYSRDEYADAPWNDCDGHGVVTDWERRNKLPGELVLAEDRGSRRFYDFVASCKLALRERWDSVPYNDGTQTKRQQAAKAARADYEYLRSWCNDDWCYLVVDVVLLGENDEEVDGYSDSLAGVESYKDYNEEIAREMAEGIARQYRADNRFTNAMALGV